MPADVIIQQTDRWLTVETPLGEDALVLIAMEGEEALSELFSFRLTMISPRETIAPADILGKNLSFSVKREDGERQFFNGVVKSFSAGPPWGRGYRVYNAEVVPWLWFLTLSADCRIFQEKSVPDIVEEVFSDLGFTDFDTSGIKNEHPKREYCVQYRETDFDFVSRLLEEEGIFYFFRRDQGVHTMVMGDQPSAYIKCRDEKVEYHPNVVDRHHIHRWLKSHSYLTGKWTQRDFNFKTPSATLETTTSSIVDVPGIKTYEVFDYPGLYDVKGKGESLTQYRIEEEETPHEMAEGGSGARGFLPGGTFTLSKHAIAAEEGKSYVITSIAHRGHDYSHVSGEGEPAAYGNDFQCIPDDVPFRPPRTTPKPVVRGPQTAFVVGPAGEEIYCDEFGRIKVQFHWDRQGKKDEKSSCWMRVGHPWAGKNWGAVFIPRIGMEVIVDFLEGDPDRPIVVAGVYNKEQMPPYALPANKTQSGIKTRSSMKGSEANFNELRFEDKKGTEEVYFHAEKDFNRIVENDDTHDIGHDQTITVENDRTRVVTSGNESVTVSKGDRTIDISAGSNFMEAAQKIVLKVGANTITLDQAGITIKGLMIKIEGSTLIDAKAPMTTVEGSGMLTLKGGIIMIN